MDTIRAICKCKELAENNLVVGIRQEPFATWGFFTWMFNILLVLISAGGWLPFIGGWVLGNYWLQPKYHCQYCKAEIEKNQIRG